VLNQPVAAFREAGVERQAVETYVGVREPLGRDGQVLETVVSTDDRETREVLAYTFDEAGRDVSVRREEKEGNNRTCSASRACQRT
jgi:hypothetical protein